MITYDARGHGDSYKPTGIDSYGIGMVDDVAALMKELNVQNAHMIGHSMGGMTALIFALFQPKTGRTLIYYGGQN